jgi:hypothetical protein
MQELRRKVWRPKAVAPKFETCSTNLDAAIGCESTPRRHGPADREASRCALVSLPAKDLVRLSASWQLDQAGRFPSAGGRTFVGSLEKRASRAPSSYPIRSVSRPRTPGGGP